MELNNICIAALVLIILFSIVNIVVKLSWKIFIIGMVILVILGIYGLFKG